ncbi:hypothetical protein ACFC1B_07285 [Streptomyces xiamenensis]|uniref:hypothetical protein n=1 Tax=Streptomyces xiamenensis TaxID=408015 RepID=UPI0035D93060
MNAKAAADAVRRAAEAHATAGALWPDALQHTVRQLIDRLAASRSLPATGLDYPYNSTATSLIASIDLTSWGVASIGDLHQLLLEAEPTRHADGTVTASRTSVGRRGELGSWYTPPELAAATVSLSLGLQLAQMPPGPESIWHINTIDPACGAGVFLLAAARYLSQELVCRLSVRPEEQVRMFQAALPQVIEDCVFGADIDPVAVDLSRAALWLEIGGTRPFSWLDRNITVGSVLEGPHAGPPAWRERQEAARANQPSNTPRPNQPGSN